MFAGPYVKLAVMASFRQSSSKIFGKSPSLPYQPPSPLINVDLRSNLYSNVALEPIVAFYKRIWSSK